MLHLDIKYPKHPLLKELITCYQIFEISSPIIMETVPNGHMDVTILLEDSFRITNLNNGTQVHVEKYHFFQISNRKLFLEFSQNCRGINIKFNPLIKCYSEFSPENHLTIQFMNKIIESVRNAKDTISEIERRIVAFLNGLKKNHSLNKLIYSILNTETEITLRKIAELNQIQIKQLTRLIKKHVGITPKELRSFHRFFIAANMLRNQDRKEIIHFSEKIPLTYYDQSHFIKECRKITGMNPKKVFKMMNFDISDILVSNES